MDRIFWILAGVVLGWAFTGEYQRRKQFQIIIKKLNMSQENLDLLLGRVNNLKTSLTNIQGDITRIKDGLPTTGGLTEAEVATLRGELEITATQADALDKENEPEIES